MKKIFLAGYPDSTQNYQNALKSLGVSADILPSQEKEPFFGDFSGYNGLLLPGGGDISPALFGAENRGSRNIDEPLDRIQLSLLDTFVRAGKPVLGICKGLQILNIYFGGTLIQDLPPHSLKIHAYEKADRIHPTKAARGTFPEKLYGSTPITNSAHHQGIGAPGDGLLVAQYSQDFVVEAMYHKSLPLLGVQWHPERMCFAHSSPYMEDGSLLLRYFLSLL